MAEQENNIIVLEDENGTPMECEVIDVFDLNESRYVAMIETAAANDEEVDVIIMKIILGETEEDSQLINIDDEDELQAAFDEFVKRDEEYNETVE